MKLNFTYIYAGIIVITIILFAFIAPVRAYAADAVQYSASWTSGGVMTPITQPGTWPNNWDIVRGFNPVTRSISNFTCGTNAPASSPDVPASCGSLADNTYQLIQDSTCLSVGVACGYWEFTVSGGSYTPLNPSPLGDGNVTTHIVRVNSPVLYSTTTSSVLIDFDYYQSSTSPQIANGYRLDFRNSLTYESFYLMDVLSDPYTADGVYNFSTTTTISTSGTWSVVVSLIDYSPDIPSAPYANISSYYPVYFGVNYNDNVTTVVSGPAYQQFSSTTCAVNFLGSFDLGQCVGYLVQPSAVSLERFNSLTLANSAPFAYAYDIGELRNELFNASSSATTTVAVTVPGFGTITFLSKAMIAAVPFSSTINLILGWLMWLLAAEFLYVTILRSHNQNTGI